jgi:tRNA (cytidine/uridine-2'-O-)-methyltransferase
MQTTGKYRVLIMFHLVLYEPEIPPNTGNIIRLCANVGAQLHLIHPLGFQLQEPALKRAGLDYHEWASIKEYAHFEAYLEQAMPARVFLCTSKGGVSYSTPRYRSSDAFLLGPETRGLPDTVLDCYPPEVKIRIPMQAQSRCLNLSNSAAVIVYEAWRQLKFGGAV